MRITSRFCAVAAVLLAGCGSSGVLTTHPASGKVTYEEDGSPVTGYVVFEPAERGAGKLAQGKLAADGSYTLSTYQEGDGAAAGRYTVYLSLEPAFMLDPDAPPVGAGPGISGPTVKFPFHQVYASVNSTPLTAEIKPGDNSSLDFSVKKGSARR